MKTSELTGALLDYWVARAMGYQTDIAKIKPDGDWCDIELRNVAPPDFTISGEDSACDIAMVPNAMREFPACVIGQKIGRGKHPYRSSWFYPSTLWTHGGPIIDRERMSFATIGAGPKGENGHPPIVAIPAEGRRAMEGPTHLIAAMRAYVASKFGDEVEDQAGAADNSKESKQ